VEFVYLQATTGRRKRICCCSVSRFLGTFPSSVVQSILLDGKLIRVRDSVFVISASTSSCRVDNDCELLQHIRGVAVDALYKFTFD